MDCHVLFVDYNMPGAMAVHYQAVYFQRFQNIKYTWYLYCLAWWYWFCHRITMCRYEHMEFVALYYMYISSEKKHLNPYFFWCRNVSRVGWHI